MEIIINMVYINKTSSSPELIIEGKKTAPILYGLSDFPGAKSNTAYAQKNIKNFAECGIELVAADTAINLGWHKNAEFEIEPMQAEIAGVLEANPNAKILLRLHLNPPYWWLRDNEDELVEYDGVKGIDDGENACRLIRNDGEKNMRASIASKKWLLEAGEILKKFCEEISNTEEGKSLIAIQVAYGVYGEWHQWGIDTGIPMREKFKEFIKSKYNTECDYPYVPSPEPEGDYGKFRNPEISQNIIDSQMCLHQATTDAILHFCKIIKENWNGDILTGSFYGYFMSKGGNMSVIFGHLLPENILSNNQYIDFLCGPLPYMENRLPDGVPMSRALLESMRLNHILWLTEMDQDPFGTQYFVGGDPKYRKETITMLRRNILLPLVSGMGAWYYDHRVLAIGSPELDNQQINPGSIFIKKGWWDCPELLDEIKKLKILADKYFMQDFKPVADVLMIYDTRTYFYQSDFVDEIYALHDSFGKCGVAYDCIYLSDLPKCDLSRYKLIIFVNTYCLNTAQKTFIKTSLSDKTLVWMYAPGFCDEKQLNTDYITEMTGMQICTIENEVAYKVDKTGEAVDLKPDRFNPMFAVCDESAVAVAHYVKSQKCAAAHKGNSWYFTAPVIPRSVAEQIIDASDVHRYIYSEDVLFAGNGIVVLSTVNGGEKEIHYPCGTKLKYNLEPMTTAVFDMKTFERIL